MGDNNKPVSPPSSRPPYSWPGNPKSDSRSADTYVDRDEIEVVPLPSSPSTRPPAHYVLGNFFLATSLISLIIFTIFLTVTWLTVLQDARSMNDRVLSNVTGVSIRLRHNE